MIDFLYLVRLYYDYFQTHFQDEKCYLQALQISGQVITLFYKDWARQDMKYRVAPLKDHNGHAIQMLHNNDSIHHTLHDKN